MTTKAITIFVGQWDGRDFVFSLSEEKAKSLVETCAAFGDPLEAKYILGNSWASSGQDVGWRITERTLTIPVVSVAINQPSSDGIAHLVWSCPFCGRFYSDDWLPGDELPVLLSCGCNIDSKYLLGNSMTK